MSLKNVLRNKINNLHKGKVAPALFLSTTPWKRIGEVEV